MFTFYKNSGWRLFFWILTVEKWRQIKVLWQTLSEWIQAVSVNTRPSNLLTFELLHTWRLFCAVRRVKRDRRVGSNSVRQTSWTVFTVTPKRVCNPSKKQTDITKTTVTVTTQPPNLVSNKCSPAPLHASRVTTAPNQTFTPCSSQNSFDLRNTNKMYPNT